MEREGKGESIGRHVSDYCVMDLETTGAFIGSSSIIEISAIKVRNDEVVDEFSTLVNPYCHIPAAATAVNHITDEMVKDAPGLNDVLDMFLAFLEDDVIVGYNNASFDMNIVYDAVMGLRRQVFGNDYIDVLHMARRCLTDLSDRKLETVSKYFGFDTEGEHRALKDCYLTKDCYDRLWEEFGRDAFCGCQHMGGRNGGTGKKPRAKSPLSYETRALRELQDILEGTIEDGRVSEEEFLNLKVWVEAHRDLQGISPFDRVYAAVDKVLVDRGITADELRELQDLFTGFVDPVKEASVPCSFECFENMHICVTGDFAYGSRMQVVELIESVGACFDSSVKRCTDLLVVGSMGSENWKTGKYGSKILKAMELRDKGSGIKLVEEAEFIPAVARALEKGTTEEKCLGESELDKKDTGNWKVRIETVLQDMMQEYELPENSLLLVGNIGRKSGMLSSYSVCISEPDYPPVPNAVQKAGRNSIVLNIQEKTKGKIRGLEFVLNLVQYEDIHKPCEVHESVKNSDPGNIHIIMDPASPELPDFIRNNVAYSLARYQSNASSFGCCSRFIECSDAKKCVHENKLYSKACLYRINLEAGRIFYGKNKNTDLHGEVK